MKVATAGLTSRCPWRSCGARSRQWMPRWRSDRRAVSARAPVPRRRAPSPWRPEASQRGSMVLERSRRLVRDARAEWGAFAFLPLITPGYVAALLVLGGQIRAEHWILAVLVPVLGFAGARGARFLRDVFPWLFVIMSYDSVRYARAAV